MTMQNFTSWAFDRINQTIWSSRTRTQLSPKAYAVLDYLYDRPNIIVYKDELLDAIWPDVYVGDSVLKNTICEIRQALEDSAKKPKFIETIHRRGYRFIGVLPVCQETRIKNYLPHPVPTPSQLAADSYISARVYYAQSW